MLRWSEEHHTGQKQDNVSHTESHNSVEQNKAKVVQSFRHKLTQPSSFEPSLHYSVYHFQHYILGKEEHLLKQYDD